MTMPPLKIQLNGRINKIPFHTSAPIAANIKSGIDNKTWQIEPTITHTKDIIFTYFNFF
jgi:hypothetical protein